MDALCKRLRDRYDIAAITNDIYTKEDAEFLTRSGALAADRILGVETGGCPHTAIREDASINLAAVADLNARFPALDLVLIESGGDNLAATFSPELADITIYVIDVAAGDKIPRKGGPGITRSDLLVINKIDLAPMVGASLEVMDRDATKMRGDRPFVFTNMRDRHRARRRRRLHREDRRPCRDGAGGLRPPDASRCTAQSVYSPRACADGVPECRSSTASPISTTTSSPGGTISTSIRNCSTTSTAPPRRSPTSCANSASTR